MAPPIVYVDVSAIREGKHEELEAAMDQLSRFVEANMPRVAFYGLFLDEARATMTVVASPWVTTLPSATAGSTMSRNGRFEQ